MLRLKKFEYVEPDTIEDACSFLNEYKENAKVLAGGTDLLVKMKQNIERPEYVLSLNRIGQLRYIDYNDKEGLRIGALTTLSDLAASPVIRQKFNVLDQAIRMMASHQIRNRATIGGNLCNASPAGDTAPPLIGLGGQARVVGLAGERVIPLVDFFSGLGCTVLKSDEILTEVQIPNPSPRTAGAYLKLSPREKDLATVAVATIITLDSQGQVCEDINIVLGAVAPTVMRSFKAEAVVKGKTVEDELIQQSAQAASEEARPMSDIRGSAKYRKEMVKVLTKWAIRQALELAKSS
jgi:carbon-monoxide dehydrogenase medium subunit